MKQFRCLGRRPFCWLFWGLYCLSSLQAQQQPLPEELALAAADSKIRPAFQQDYDEAKTPAQKLQLVKNLLGAATHNQNIADKFVLQRLAAELAAELGELPLAMSIIDKLGGSIANVDLLRLKIEALAKAGAQSKKLPLRSASLCRELHEQAIKTERYELAAKSLAVFSAIAKQSQDPPLIQESTEWTEDLVVLERSYREMQQALQVLERDPANAEANFRAGKYFALHRGDLIRGLPYLARGSDAACRTMALQELAVTIEPGDRVKLADQWWRLAESAPRSAQATLRAHAIQHYLVGIEGVDDANQCRVGERLAEYLAQQIRIPTPAPVPAGRRSTAQKARARQRFGASDKTAAAIKLSLLWLQKQQHAKDGSWSLTSPHKDGAAYENPVAATALALYTFQGDGHSDREGEFQATVQQGWSALLKMQDQEGLFTSAKIENHNHLFYSHGLALLAVVDMYALTEDEKYKKAAQRAVDYAVKNQDKQKGGWRYLPGNDSDTSVTGWICLGLWHAKQLGLDVPQETLDRVSAFLDSAQKEGGSTYTYRPGYGGITAAVSASGLLMRQRLGWKQDDERFVQGAKKILGHPMVKDDRKVYYWYYATQFCFHMQGETWKTWNADMQKILLPAQTTNGAESGSWDPEPDEWGVQGGRIFVTCLCTLMLETPQRDPPHYELPK